MSLGLRSETAGLVRLAERDLAALWRLVEAGASAETALRDLLPGIVARYGEAGAAVAADWYDQMREQSAARGRFTAAPLKASDRGAHSLIGWALRESADDAGLHTLILGGVQRRVADHMRLTVAHASVADPAAQGWVRVGTGECDWCRRYLDGEVRTVAGYGFDAHDNCRCSVRPAWA